MGCGARQIARTDYETVEVDRYINIPPVFTDPLFVPGPPDGMTFGKGTNDYPLTLIELLDQANRDRAQVEALSGQVVDNK